MSVASDVSCSPPLTAQLLLGLRGRIRTLAERRADLAWSGVLAHLHARAGTAARAIAAACERPAVLARVHARLRAELAWRTPANENGTEACVELLALSSLAGELRAALPSVVEALEPGAPETRGEASALEEVRRHRQEARQSFASVKRELWNSVTAAAVREADALALVLATSCRGRAREGLLALLAASLEATPGGAADDLATFAEQVAARRLLDLLGPARPAARARRPAASVSRVDRSGASAGASAS